MPTLLPFPARRVRQSATLLLNASRGCSLTKPTPWRNRPEPPEALGNLLQRLVVLQPAAVLLIENVVAEMLAQLES